MVKSDNTIGFEELIQRKYHDPYGFITNAIRRKKLNKTIDYIDHQENEDKTWEMYLAVLSNSFSEQMSFEDFKARMINRNAQSQGVSDSEMNQIVSQSEDILNQFDLN